MIYIDHLFHLINLTHVLQKVDETTFHACDIYISLNSRLSIAAWDVIKNTCTKVRIHVRNNVD